MEKTTHSSVTECSFNPHVEKTADDMIKEVAADPPAQKGTAPSYGIRRTGTINRRRDKKPLPLDRFAHAFHRIPRAAKVLLVVIPTGIPFMIFMLVAKYRLHKVTIGDERLHATWFKLAKWMTVCWASLLIIFALAEIFARFASWTCNQTKHLVKYAPLANTLCFRLTLLLWSIVAYAYNCNVWVSPPVHPKHKIKNNWPATLKQTFVFLIISFAVILVQGIVLQLIAIRYVEGYVGPRARKGLKEIETIRHLNDLVKKHFEHDDPSYFVKIFKRIFFPVEDSDFDAITNGTASEEEHRAYAARLWTTLSVDMNREVFNAEDISSRMKAMGRDPEAAEDLFVLLDENHDGQVTRDELEALVVKTGAQLNKRADSMKGIKKLLFKLEFLLTCVVFGIIVFIYSNFFNQDWVKDSKALWTGVTGLGFALNGTIADFVASCVFVFAKHAYDVGDLIEAKTKKLLVLDIHLTHTNFREIREGEAADATGMVVQISHSSLAAEPIVNWTRSDDLKIAKKEQEDESDAPAEVTRPSATGFTGW